ncbi:ubiquinone biosynthesis O-methyltransferase, mitochondrial isoform X2 [Scyliorhinus canicula]|uniref:ubiquinone biosynthesis O-methyltransferase, mitochondrial isoform X2 n=1 Tax=Scyliorhinus canicula TaxID=7830 RepID=UPI0018F4A5D4|nr:ubiquinone biosynthesis O-methyltransferase, mitochondrial isoform X2 [Scyliorhinus canicula]
MCSANCTRASVNETGWSCQVHAFPPDCINCCIESDQQRAVAAALTMRLLCTPGRSSQSGRQFGVLGCALRAGFCDWNAMLARPGFRTPTATSLQPCTVGGAAAPGTSSSRSRSVQARHSCRHASRMYSTSKTTVEPGEVKKFQALSQKWWDGNGEFAALHALNDLRVPFIRDALLTYSEKQQLGCPLHGFRILDVGCGGGLLSEPLGRLGAMVTGIDPLKDNIRTAEMHKSFDPAVQEQVQYTACSLEEMAVEATGMFDAVVASEVVEHVADVETFIRYAAQMLKPGGSLFLTTINKTFLSYVLAIVTAEKILRIVPNGTHEWERFISPDELERLLVSSGFTVETINGMVYNPLFGSWSWSSNVDVNYALHAVKNKIEEQSDFTSETGDRCDNGINQSESSARSTVTL